MLIFSPYSRRKDEQLQSILKFSGPRNNLKEIITGFFQKRPGGLTQSASLTDEWEPRQRWKESCTPVNQYWLFFALSFSRLRRQGKLSSKCNT